MSAPPVSSLTPALVVLALFIFIMARRTVGQLQGTRFSAGRLFGFAGFYVLLFALLAAATLYAAVTNWGTAAYALFAPYVAVPAAAAYLAAPYVRRVVRFELRSDGQWYYRLSWHVPVLYLSLFVARIVAEVAVLGLSAVLVTFPPPAPSSAGAVEILIGVDLLFGLSLGLLVGRGIGVYRAHRDLSSSSGAPSPPSPPLPSG